MGELVGQEANWMVRAGEEGEERKSRDSLLQFPRCSSPQILMKEHPQRLKLLTVLAVLTVLTVLAVLAGRLLGSRHHTFSLWGSGT